jgi:hypothetical protein
VIGKMSDTTDNLDGSVLEWLLASSVPSIRYLTTRYHRKRDDPRIRSEIVQVGPVPTILAGQSPAGNWAGEHSYYTPKYVSTHWSLLLAVELAADGNDPRLRAGTEFMLSATRRKLERETSDGRYEMSCFWGNLLRYAEHCGYGDDARVEAVTQCLVLDGLETSWRCKHNDELPCAWGCARALWGLASRPESKRSPSVRQTIDKSIGWLLNAHSLVVADYSTTGRIHSLWSRLSFPLFYQADILFVLRVLVVLGRLDHPGAADALEWLRDRRMANGRWRGANPYRRRTWAGIADGADTDRWATLYALHVLDSAREIR